MEMPNHSVRSTEKLIIVHQSGYGPLNSEHELGKSVEATGPEPVLMISYWVHSLTVSFFFFFIINTPAHFW